MDGKKCSYEEARKLIQSGDVVFVRNKKGFVASVIRFFTRSKYSHVGFAFWVEIEGTPRLLMLEAQGGAKRRIVNISFYKEEKLDIIAAPKPWRDIAPTAMENLGQVAYGWLEAGYVGIREALMKGPGWTLPYKDMPGEICSEFVARMLGMEQTHVSPQLLWEMLETENEVRVEVRKVD